jgi:hypothetical protein
MSGSPITNEKLKLAIDLIKVIYDGINASGKMGMPSGHIYGALMNMMSLETYEKAINIMVNNGLIEKRGDLLFAKSPIKNLESALTTK